MTLASLQSPDKPLVLVFADAACGPCRALLPDVALWQAQYPDAFDLAVISRGTADANREKFATLDPRRILLQQQRETAKAYRVLGTPSAVVVLAEGTIGRPLANAEAEIRSLIWRLVKPGAPEPAPAVAPPFALPDLDGVQVRSEDLRGTATLLFFHRQGCGLCTRLLPDLRAWEEEPGSGRARLLVVSSASPDESRAFGLSSTIVLDPDSSVRKRYGVLGTPSGILLDRAGYIISNASGRSGVLRLLGRPAALSGFAAAASAEATPASPATLPAGARPVKDSCVEDGWQHGPLQQLPPEGAHAERDRRPDLGNAATGVTRSTAWLPRSARSFPPGRTSSAVFARSSRGC
jgi:peroxiredoxin